MIKCLVVDDEQSAIDILVHYIHLTDGLELAGTATTATGALSIFHSQKIDLLFQDIHLPDLSGIDLVKVVRDKCDVIFTTAYTQYAIEGFDLGVADYLLKPISFPRFTEAIKKAAKKHRNRPEVSVIEPGHNDRFIYVKTGQKNSITKIDLGEIHYFESRSNYVAIHLASSEILVYISMKELMLHLSEKGFIRVHRCYIVPLAKILKVEGSDILLEEVKNPIPLSDTYKAVFWEKIDRKTIG